MVNELEIIKTAVINEVEGYSFYRLAAEKTDDLEVKESFNLLAEEEKKHETWLRALYRDISEGTNGQNDADKPVKGQSPGIFRRENMNSESGSLEVSVLRIGILMEKASIDFYREAAEKTGNPRAKELYENLVEWEREHMESLEKMYEMAREEWWDRQGFSPA
ncbi:ferritin-like domain-containing protein [Candidatus Contubernalis alkaliaceticus]|uniref:ferritin-like domain-containing protein n=1 Tax=Candidatus Contubernalis alkaliaceticus TaxID=338645 RepID=UPI001F4BE078|nr:ferritin family protein [Candidatus Contubernalis alkalaceticus]UNC92974.1 ferritin family protein [Candidatus Contubernalis alkalaceticus]